MPMRVRVEGLKKLRVEAAKAAVEIRVGTVEAVEETAHAIRDQAKDDAPVGDTGRLRDGIEAHIEPGGLEAVVGVFGPAADYAVYPHFGTSRQEAQPFMDPAVAVERRDFPVRVSAEVRRRLT